MTPNDLPTAGYARDAAEIEGYLRGFARRRADVSTTVLRFASLVGPRIDTVVTRYFALPVVPTVLGYDARLQLLHEEDALAVLERAVAHDLPGVVNVAADGVLLLSQAIRRAGRVPLPVPPPAVGVVGRALAVARIASFSPEQLRLLDFGRVVDTTRLRTAFGFTPRWTTAQAFDDFVRGRALHPMPRARAGGGGRTARRPRGARRRTAARRARKPAVTGDDGPDAPPSPTAPGSSRCTPRSAAGHAAAGPCHAGARTRTEPRRASSPTG